MNKGWQGWYHQQSNRRRWAAKRANNRFWKRRAKKARQDDRNGKIYTDF